MGRAGPPWFQPLLREPPPLFAVGKEERSASAAGVNVEAVFRQYALGPQACQRGGKDTNISRTPPQAQIVLQGGCPFGSVALNPLI